MTCLKTNDFLPKELYCPAILADFILKDDQDKRAC